MSYCIYLRKSRPDIEAEKHGEGETLARHQSMLMELAKRCKLDVVKVYREIVSGDSISARPQMQALLSDIGQGKYEGVLVAEVERLARGNTIDQGIVAQTLKESGTKIITPMKTYDPSNEIDEEFFEFSLFMSRREYKTIRRRLEAGRLSAVKEGNYIGTNAPYGYRKTSPDPKTHTLEIIPEEAETVRLIYKLYLENHGSAYISAELNRMGVPTKRNTQWEQSIVNKILTNPLYCGKVTWKTKSGSAVYDGKHEPIVTESIFNEVQIKKKTNPVPQFRKGDTLQNYYHGVLYCKNCGHQMRRKLDRTSRGEFILCSCNQCRGKTVSSSIKEVDEALLSTIRYRLESMSKISDLSNEKHEEVKPDRKKTLEAELKRLKKQRERLFDLLEQEVYDTATFVERSEIINQKIKNAESVLAEISSESEKPKLSPHELEVRLKYILDNFEGADAEERNSMLKNAISKVYYVKTEKMCYRKTSSDLSLEVEFL